MTDSATIADRKPGLDWGLVQRQMRGILRLELKKNLLRRRAFFTYLLALTPVAILALWAITKAPKLMHSGPLEAVTVTFPVVFEVVIRTSIFFATLILFMSLFRAEILEQSLHYYFLTPVRRQVLVAGKYLSALAAVSLVFMVATVLLYVLTLLPWGVSQAMSVLLSGSGLGNLIAYLGVVILACAGYGSIFLLVGLFFKNPIVPATFIWGWEAINFLLPALLKKLSVIHYLQSLYPVPLISSKLGGVLGQIFEVVVEPTPAWISVPGIVLFTSAVLLIAGYRAQHMEISYGGD